jgi:subtilisin family serine protease
VISISLGGLPSNTLKAAVDEAAAKNVIVVAAAGNQIRKVVFPGGYSNVMGVAASNYKQKPWKGSSRGRRVKITAPGESVWVAASRPQQWCLQAGDGTSFATATTAGVAALWLAYQRDQKAALALNPSPGDIPAAFHAAVAAGYTPVNDWDTRRYGPGIIDAEKVVKTTPQPTAAGRKEFATPQACPGQDALSAVLDDEAGSATRASALLGVADPCSVETIATEIVTLYGLDNDVGAAIDALAGSTSPTARDYRRVRNVLLGKPVSNSLRDVLTKANAQ